MDDLHNNSSETGEVKNILPDVVHSQQPLHSTVEQENTTNILTGQCSASDNVSNDDPDASEIESISEHLPSKLEESLSHSELHQTHEPENLSRVKMKEENVAKSKSLDIPAIESPRTENLSSQCHDLSNQSLSLPIDLNVPSDVHNISKESPVNLALSSDYSKDAPSHESPPLSPLEKTHISESIHKVKNYSDSLNESVEDSENSNKSSLNNSDICDVSQRESSGSEEIIKLDIRGQGIPKYQFPTAQIIFGPPPEGSTIIDPNIASIPVFQNLLSPFLVGAGDNLKFEEVFDFASQQSKGQSPDKSVEVSSEKASLEERYDLSPEKSLEISPERLLSLSSEKSEQRDLLVEEITVDDMRETDEKLDEPNQPKSIAPEETLSFCTMTTDYKTICEEYHAKLVHFEDAIMKRDKKIQELTVSLQCSVRERDDIKAENEHLTNEVFHLQHLVGERSLSEHDTVKAQLSDFVKYQSMFKDDSTKFYSAIMSGGSSLHSSNGEKDMDNEEITVNYSKSDLKSSDSSGEFQTGFENKLSSIINKFDEQIEENLRNKLRESIIQVLCDEIGRMKLDFDTEIKELESQLHQAKQTNTTEIRKLRELLSSVEAGNTDIDTLRNELSKKHVIEMENLRTYFEKKCTDMERSYSEDVWRGKACVSPAGSASSLETAAGGDFGRRRTRSAELPSLSLESTPLEQAMKQTCRKYEQQIEELRADHVSYVADLQARHAQTAVGMEEQIIQLKTHIQTSENTDTNVSVYQQDIDLELEKDAVFQRRVQEVKDGVLLELQEQIQVLLSDPDAEVSSWPHELVALRDKIHGDTRLPADKELREELSGGEDKWKQRRNLSFDQNRHLEEVTKERDGLKRVAVSLHGAVSQLVTYCARAEDELNQTVLAQLLGRLLGGTDTFEESSRPSTPNLSIELNTSVVAQGKHVHFAPDLNSLLVDLDEESIENFLQHQRDLSVEIKTELEHSLKRLQLEAHALVDLSSRLAHKKRDSLMLESATSPHIAQLVDELDSRRGCDECDMHKKNMEEAMAECLQRENLLRSDLEAAMVKIAQLMTAGDQINSDIVAEGYGAGRSPPATRHRLSGPPEPDPRSPDPGSPDGSPGRQLDQLLKERDDLHQQLEAANRQLRSTRQFLEEQANEREHERDTFATSLAALRDENARLSARLGNNARILLEMQLLRVSDCSENKLRVEQLETQAREMNQLIEDLESKKALCDKDLNAKDEKIALLQDIIADLESRLEQKSVHETEVLEQLEGMRHTIDDRDSKMRSLLGELESLKSEKQDQKETICASCLQEEDKCNDILERVKEQCIWLEQVVNRRTQRIERVHEECSGSCSEPSEDVSIRDHLQIQSPSQPGTPRSPPLGELLGVWECLQALYRAEDAALKRILDLEMQRAHLKDVAQEVRAERDVLQARMSEQALKISSLSARLQQHRNDATALAHHASSQLSVQLHDASAEVQKLKEDLELKEKQIQRLKHTLNERDKLNEQHQSLYGNSCNPKDKVVILERELSSAQCRIAQLEALTRGLETDREQHLATIRDHQRALAEKEDQLQELLALKLDDEKEEKSEMELGKVSARTLSDIVSISDFDEQDLQMRRAELKAHNMSLTGAPYISESRDKNVLNRTLPPDLQRPNMSSLNIDYIDSDIPHYTHRADSLPTHLTSTQNKDVYKQYKRNVNETTLFGIEKVADNDKQCTVQKIQDNISMYPNRDVSESKNLTVEPKQINFSIEPSDNKTQEEFTSLRELGIAIDINQENFPDILSQLKHEIKKSRSELENCRSDLKNAEEQLCEFPALKEEVEELKSMLENTMATMNTDKKFYENQLDHFSSNKKLLEQRMTELTQEVNDKSKDLHLLKEDILRRENMILELAKEKRNLTNKLTELEEKAHDLQSRNNSLENCETENRSMKERMLELKKLEQLVSEKNQQIDSLNQHLDRLDDMQRCLNDKTEELDNLKEAFEEKSNEIFQVQDTIESLNRDVEKLTAENNELNNCNKELKLQLTKLEKEQENSSLKLQNSESEFDRLNSELISKIEELKLLTDRLKDKETEIEILNEDINSFHEEIASLKEQLKMVSRSPSPRNKNGEEKKPLDRQASSDKKQLVKIRKQISLLQHELDFNKKELNDKAFELAKAKLDVTELKNNYGQANKLAADRELVNAELRNELEHLIAEKRQLAEQLEAVTARIREESNISELKAKLREKVQRCQELEEELQDMKDMVDRIREPQEELGERALVVSGSRSPTAELERALRDQLDYSHTLDEHIMTQILSASSDEHEEIPRLALNTSKSSSSVQSSSSERAQRLHAQNEKLQAQVASLELRIKDKDALITELNRIRDKLSSDYQNEKLRHEAERDNAARFQLLLAAHKDTADSLQNQDASMIQMLKKRLESAMQSEVELQSQLQEQRARATTLQRPASGDGLLVQLQQQLDKNERLQNELSVARTRLEAERARCSDATAELERVRARSSRAARAADVRADAHAHEMHDAARLKHEASVELLRAKELISIQSSTIAELEKKLTNLARQNVDARTELLSQKSDTSPKKWLTETNKDMPDERDQAVRYLHGRCVRLESCRKALVWQKRYLQRVLAPYAELEKSLRPVTPSPPLRRFKSVVAAVRASLRLQFLVRRRAHSRALAAACLLPPPNANQSTAGRSPVSRIRRPDNVASPAFGVYMRGSPFANSPRQDPFISSSPRGEMATAYLNKLELVSRCIARARDKHAP